MRLSAATLAALTGLLPPERAADFSAREMTAARKLSLTKCTKCHKFYEPKNYTVPEWDGWMEKMAKKSKLKPEQAMLLTRYFELRRTGTDLEGTKERKR